jgi:hypothetical protein
MRRYLFVAASVLTLGALPHCRNEPRDGAFLVGCSNPSRSRADRETQPAKPPTPRPAPQPVPQPKPGPTNTGDPAPKPPDGSCYNVTAAQAVRSR